MPATAFDPKTALVVIDLQKGIAVRPTVHPIQGVIAHTARLAEAFRAAGLPVVLVTVGWSEDGGDALRTRTDAKRPPMTLTKEMRELVPELTPKPGDLLITKRQWSAFYGTELDLQLRRRGITGIVLTGVATSIGVDTTARAANERAYNLTFASDAMTDMDPSAHEFALTKIFPRIGEVETTDAILALMKR